MSKLTLRHNNDLDTIELKFKNSELQGFLSNSLSQESRIWNAQKRVWVIVPEVLHDVIAYSRHLFNHIDCSSLPIRYQTTVQNALSGKLKTDKIGSEYKGTEEGLYSKLYLLPTAPTCVTQAVYKCRCS